jgi:beta-phosphoglucomutase
MNSENYENQIVRDSAVIFDYKTNEGRQRIKDVFQRSHLYKINGNPEAILFDMDGVLADTNVTHYKALISAFEEVSGHTVSCDIVDKNSMLNTREKLEMLAEYYKININIDFALELKDTKFNSMINSYKEDTEKQEMLQYIRDKGIKLAVISNSRRHNIIPVLDKLGLTNFFDAIVSGQDDVKNKKPAPDIIFKAYKLLGIDYMQENNVHQPARFKTLVVEDSLEGIKAVQSTPSFSIKVENSSQVNKSLFKKWINDK